MKLLSFLFLLLAILSITGIYYFKKADIPSSYLPWEPLDLQEQLGPFSRLKLSSLKGNLPACLEALDRAGISYSALGDSEKAGCSLEDQVTLDQSNYAYSQTVSGRCELIASLIMWEENILQPLATEYFDSEIERIRHSGIFSCRNIRGSSRRSQHASANAIDISGFVLKNGTQISILRDWNDDNIKANFLKTLNKESCAVFNTVLGPRYNEAHKDHYHFDLGPYNICS